MTNEVEELSIVTQQKKVRCCFVSLNNRPVDIYWQKNQKESYVYGQLQYHEMLQIDTYEGHIWHFYDAIDGQELQIIYPVMSLYYTVEKKIGSDVVYVFVGVNLSQVSLLKTCLRYLYDYISAVHGKKTFQTPELIQSLGLGIDVQKKMALYFINALKYQSNVNPAVRSNCAKLTDRLVISIQKTGQNVTYKTGATSTNYELARRMHHENSDDSVVSITFENSSMELKHEEDTQRHLFYVDDPQIVKLKGIGYDLSSILNKNLDDSDTPSSSQSVRRHKCVSPQDPLKENVITRFLKTTVQKLSEESNEQDSISGATNIQEATQTHMKDIVLDNDQL